MERVEEQVQESSDTEDVSPDFKNRKKLSDPLEL